MFLSSIIKLNVIIMALTWDFYLNLICSIRGVILFIVSLLLVGKIKKLFPGARILKKWNIIQILIYIFLVGYVSNIVFLFLEITNVVLVMTAIVYIFGGFFVYLVINLTYKTYKVIIEESDNEE